MPAWTALCPRSRQKAESSQENADVAVFDVPRCVQFLALRHRILAGAFRDHDHRVASAFEPLLQRFQELKTITAPAAPSDSAPRAKSQQPKHQNRY
jgi:hypothetical protein